MYTKLICRLSLCALLSIVVATASSCSRAKKYGYVSMEKVVKSHPKHLAFLMSLQKQEQAYTESRRSLVERMGEMKIRLDTLTEDSERSVLENELNKEFKKLQVFDAQIKVDLENQSREVMNQVVGEIQGTIETYRATHHYTSISNNPADLNTLSADDITDLITIALQEKYIQD